MSTRVSSQRLSEIAREVMTAIDAPDIFGFLNGNVGDMKSLEEVLRTVLAERQKYECLELAMYLRCSFSRREHTPSWQPLLNAAIEMCRMRGENEVMFYGMSPDIQRHPRNTDGMAGPQHPQMRKH